MVTLALRLSISVNASLSASTKTGTTPLVCTDLAYEPPSGSCDASSIRLSSLSTGQVEHYLWEDTDVFITSDIDVIESKPKDKKLIIIDQSYNTSYDCDLRINNIKELDSLNVENIWQLKEIQ